MRRKGEKPVERRWPPYGPNHPVARSIATGDPWFRAWMIQTGPLPRLTKLSGITFERLMQLDRGEAPTLDEIEALARAWKADVSDVIRSLPEGSIDPSG